MVTQRSISSTPIDVAGLVIEVEAPDAVDRALLQRVLGDRPAAGPAAVRLTIGAAAPSLPARAPDFRGPYGDHWDDGVTHAFRHHWGLAAVVGDDGAAIGGPAQGFERWVAVRNTMLFVLARLYLARDRFLVHGAALARGGAAVLVVGDSGVGKSTLAFAGARAGWRVLGDDMVVVGPTADGPMVQGVPRVPSVPGDVAACAGVRGDRLPGDERDRVELTGFPLDPSAHTIAAVVRAGHDQGGGTVAPLEPVPALQALVPAFVLAELEQPVRRWFPVASALARGRCASLHHPADVDDRLRRGPELLAAVETWCRPAA